MDTGNNNKSKEIHLDDDDDSGYEADGSPSPMLTQEKKEELAKQESRAVFFLRVIVLLVLVSSAVAVVTSVYMYMTQQETDEFESTFNNDATKVFEAIGKTLDQTLGAMDSFVVQSVAYAKYSNSTYPFVTMPDYGIPASKLLLQSKAFQVSMAYIVAADQREQWEEYASDPENNRWVDETIDYMEKDDEWTGTINRNWTASHCILGLQECMEEPTPYMGNYFPRWQTYPLVPPLPGQQSRIYNTDQWGYPPVAAVYHHSVQNQRVVISPPGTIYLNESDKMGVMMAEAGKAWAKPYIRPDDDPSEPICMTMYPIYNSMESKRLDVTKELPIVGMLQYGFFWRDLIRNILPLGSDGVMVTFNYLNNCGVPFTYRLDGPKAVYLGPGDLHDDNYDYLGRSQTLFQIMESTKESDEGSTYSGIPLDNTYCPLTISVYPSKAMEDDHLTNDPIIFTILAGAIFLFTSLVFIAYDCISSRRQRIVKERALASGAIVQSLFPEKVRKQMYEEQENEIRIAKNQNFQAFLNPDMNGPVTKGSKPNADLFHNTTVVSTFILDVCTSILDLRDSLYSFLKESNMAFTVFTVYSSLLI